MNSEKPKGSRRIKLYSDHLYNLYYKQKPVDILTFLSDPYFLGKSTDGGNTTYPVWKNYLKEIFYDDSRYLVVLTGAIGIGKTETAVKAICYILYRLLCLKNPWSYFHSSDGGKMAVAFFNLTKSLSHSKGFNTLQTYLMKSEWFYKNGGVLRGSKDTYMELPLFEWQLASPYARGFGLIGGHTIAALMDEVDSPTESEAQKVRVLSAYEATVRRFESRFVPDGSTLGRFFLVASKQDEMSFLNTFVDEMKTSGRVYVADVSLWDAKSAVIKYSGVKFHVTSGDGYSPARILKTPEEVLEAKTSGLQVIDVPIEYKEDFERDVVGALRDLGGISVKGVRKSKLFPSEKYIEECWDATKLDPVKRITIDIGLKDEVELIDFLDLAKIRLPLNVPRCLSCDIAFSGDALGLAMSGVKGWGVVESEREDGTFTKSKAPIVETDFVIRLLAKEGDRIPLHKVRKFIFDLRTRGCNIIKYTADLKLASEDTFQILERAGIKTEYFSVDKDIKYYLDFRNMVYEKRWVCHKHSYLFFELKNLEFSAEKNKVDHPDKVKDVEFLEDGNLTEVVLMGSKDLSDCVVASVINIIKDMVAPMDIEGMKKIMKSIAAESTVEAEKDKYWWVKDARSGKPIVGASNEDLQRFKSLLRRQR